MPSYKIIGADQKEYGPISAEMMREWAIQGRVDSDTRVCSAEGGPWQRLADVPELAKAILAGEQAICSRCGEKIEEGFDSCWKCGTGRDGATPIQSHEMQQETSEAANRDHGRCPACGSGHIRPGKLRPSGDGSAIVFRPEGRRFFTFSLWGGVLLDKEDTCACLDCGLVWSRVDPQDLRNYISKHCD